MDEPENTPLFQLLVKGDNEAFIKYVESTNADIEERNEYGETPLFYSSKNGQHRLVRYLIHKGANLESRDNGNFTPLHSAAIYGHFRCAKILLDAGANSEARDDIYNSCPLIAAVYWGFTNIVQLLCMHEETVSGMTAKFGYGPLTLAAFKGFTKIAQILLKHNANVKERAANGITPLIAASSQGNLAMVKLLMNHDAPVNVKNNNGETPLYGACSYGGCDVVKFLIQNGASLQKANSDGDTPIHVACLRGHADVVEILLKHGAEPNRLGQFNRTPLHCAALRKNKALMKLLIDFDANIDLVDCSGHSALDFLGDPDTVRKSRHALRTPLERRSLSNDKLPATGLKLSKSLTEIDMPFLQSEMCNSIATINKFMKLCKRQFPLARGLESIRFKTEIFAPQAPGFMQILSKDSNQSQWILLSTMDSSGSLVQVYDPYIQEPHSHELKCKLASQIRYTNFDRGHIIVQVMNVKQGLCSKDTGPLVMAFATDILLSRDPTVANYCDTHVLRQHVKECMHNKKLTQFPRQTPPKRRGKHTAALPQQLSTFQLSSNRPSMNLMTSQGRPHLLHSIRAWYKMELYCICHMPYDNEMISCSSCQRFFHPSCLFGNISIPEASDGTKYLLCFECSPNSRHNLTPIHQPNLNNANLQYDLFVSYSYADFKFVRQTFLKTLDRRDGNGNYDLMVCHRDWPIGGAIVDTIVEKMEESVKAVAIISKGFLRGEFTHYEWQMMIHCKPYASAVILLDPPDSLEMSGYLRTLLASRMYLEWSDDPKRQVVFWQKLKRFLGKPLHQLRNEMNKK